MKMHTHKHTHARTHTQIFIIFIISVGLFSHPMISWFSSYLRFQDELPANWQSALLKELFSASWDGKFPAACAERKCECHPLWHSERAGIMISPTKSTVSTCTEVAALKYPKPFVQYSVSLTKYYTSRLNLHLHPKLCPSAQFEKQWHWETKTAPTVHVALKPTAQDITDSLASLPHCLIVKSWVCPEKRLVTCPRTGRPQ